MMMKKPASMRHAENDRQVESTDGLNGKFTQARKAEHLLGEDGAAEETTEVEAEDGDDRRHHRAHGVPSEHHAFSKTLGSRGAHVILAKCLEHRGPSQSSVRRGIEPCQRHPGQEQAGGPTPWIGGERCVVRGLEPMQLEHEQQLRDLTREEDGHGYTRERANHDGAVNPCATS